MIAGGCLCNGIRYEYDGAIEEILLCHCSMCRKAQGSADWELIADDLPRFPDSPT